MCGNSSDFQIFDGKHPDGNGFLENISRQIYIFYIAECIPVKIVFMKLYQFSVSFCIAFLAFRISHASLLMFYHLPGSMPDFLYPAFSVG